MRATPRYERKIQPMPKLGPWVEELERRLEANEKKPRRDRLSLLRIHEVWTHPGSGGALHRLHCFCLEFDGACEVQRRVPSDWVIEPIDVSGMAVSAWLLDMNTVLRSGLDGFEEGLDDGVIIAISLTAH